MENNTQEISPKHQFWEIASAFLLGFAALASSWAGYQAALWDGQQAKFYTRADALRVQANRHSTAAGQLMGFDSVILANWMNARAVGNKELEQFYRNHFRPEFVPVFEAWLASDPFLEGKLRSNPFLLSQYKSNLFANSLRLETEAEQTFKKGETANQISDSYVRVTVLFSSVLFFAGIASQFESRLVRAALLVLAAVMCAWASYELTALPLA